MYTRVNKTETKRLRLEQLILKGVCLDAGWEVGNLRTWWRDIHTGDRINAGIQNVLISTTNNLVSHGALIKSH